MSPGLAWAHRLPRASGRRALRARRPVPVPEIAVRIDDITHSLFQRDDVGKAPVPFAIPHEMFPRGHLEDAARAGNQRNFAEIAPEGVQQFLCHPSGPQQPLALRAVGDGDPRSCRAHGPRLTVKVW